MTQERGTEIQSSVRIRNGKGDVTIMSDPPTLVTFCLLGTQYLVYTCKYIELPHSIF